MSTSDIDKEILSWELVSYGKTIRGHPDTTTEDQVAEAVTNEMAERLVACFNYCNGKSLEELTQRKQELSISKIRD